MDQRLLEHYNRELRFLREMGVEFAKRYPKIAGRLDLGSTECADPYVERLLEGVAFLTARVQLKMEAEFPRFTQHLLEMVYPHYLAPLPSMAVVRFEPDLQGGVTEEGFLLPRHTDLRGHQVLKGHVNPRFRTAHHVKLWPIRLREAKYLPRGEAARWKPPQLKGVKGAIRLHLQTVEDIPFQALDLHELPFYLSGSGDLPVLLYELLMAHNLGILVRCGQGAEARQRFLHRRHLTALGFAEDEALLPATANGFQGYRLLQEYFALPERYLFVRFERLRESIQACQGTELELVVFLDKAQDELEDLVDENSFSLYCTPAINLFPKRADRIHLTHKSTEHHLVVDKTRPRDYEVYSVQRVVGFGSGNQVEQVFQPFYSVQDGLFEDGRAYYTISRQPTLEPIKNQGRMATSRYLGSEVYISLVDANQAPYSHRLKQLGVDVYCTNRGLARFLLSGQEVPEFSLDIGAPVNAVRSLTGFTEPRSLYPEGEYAWRLISHLSLNYLTLLDQDEEAGAKALRELLSLYADHSDASLRKQIEGVLSVRCRQVVRRLPIAGPMSFGRGVEIELLLDDAAFQGQGAFLLGAVLERFFSKYVSLNSFTQTRVKTLEQGELVQWPVRTGTRMLF